MVYFISLKIDVIPLFGPEFCPEEAPYIATYRALDYRQYNYFI